MVDDEIEKSSRWKNRVFFFVIIISISLLAYPAIQEDLPYLQTLKAAKELMVFLTNMRTQSILKKIPMEARFSLPDKIEFFEVSSCKPRAEFKKISQIFLSTWKQDVEFVENVSNERAQTRYCYDPEVGSSLSIEGLTQGLIFLAHHLDLESEKSDRYVEIIMEGAKENFELGSF